MTDSLISIDPAVMLGKPVIRGTRIAVDLVVRKFSEGATEADVLDAFPHLTREGIRAALAHDAARRNAIKLLEGLGISRGRHRIRPCRDESPGY
jgi:uncharacterized protein (DUF433 family)